MKQHEPDVAIPYWDTTLDQPLPEPRESVLFSKHFIGKSEGKIRDGHFSRYSVLPECEEFGKTLTRNMAANPEAGVFLFSNEDIEYVMGKKSYRDLIVPFDTKFEDDHGAVHVYIGGHMLDLTCAANDPIFWLLHAFIDCTWEEFRQNSQETDPELDYPSEEHEDYSQAHKPYSYMEPFKPLYNIHGLSNHYYNYYSTCAPRVVKCKRHSDCGSDFLWCDRAKRSCRSMIRLGGNCTGLIDDTVCYGEDARCVNAKCTDDSREVEDSSEEESSKEDSRKSKYNSDSRKKSVSRENSVEKSAEKSREKSAEKSREKSSEKSRVKYSGQKSNSRSKSSRRSEEKSKERSKEKSSKTPPEATSPEEFAYKPYWRPPYKHDPNGFYPSFLDYNYSGEKSGDEDNDRNNNFRPYKFGNYFGKRRR